MNKLRDREVETGKTEDGRIFFLRHKAIEEDFSEVRVVVVGNMDAGGVDSRCTRLLKRDGLIETVLAQT